MVGGKKVDGLGFIFAEVGSVVSSPIKPLVAAVAVGVVAVAVDVVAAEVGLGFIFAEVGSVVSSPINPLVVAVAVGCNCRFFTSFLSISACFFVCFSLGFFLFLDFFIASSVTDAGVVRSVSWLLLDLSDSSNLRTNVVLGVNSVLNSFGFG